MLIACCARNLERLRSGADLLFEENVAVEVYEPEHATSFALDGNPVFVESVEVLFSYFLMAYDGVSSRI